MSPNIQKGEHRAELERYLKTSTAKASEGIRFDQDTFIPCLADFIEEFGLETAILKSVWEDGECRFLPDGAVKQSISLTAENDRATVRIGFTKDFVLNPDKKVNAQIEVVLKNKPDGIHKIAMGYTTRENGEKSKAGIEIFGGENNRLIASAKFRNLGTDRARVEPWIREDEYIDIDVKTMVLGLDAETGWDVVKEMLKFDAGL